MNKVILIGRVGQDPEVRYMPNGKAVANLSLATTKKWKDKSSGERKEATEWHRCVFYEKLAEIVGEYVKKGHLISVEGENRTRKWTDKAGVDRYTTEVVVGMDGSMEMLTAKTHDQQQQASSPSAHHSAAQGSNQGYHTGTAEGFNDDAFFDDDVPY